MGININLAKDPSKQEEIEVLEKLAKYFKEHKINYLYDLFSDDLINTAAGMIKNDFPADVLGHQEERERKERIRYEDLKKEKDNIDFERLCLSDDQISLLQELSRVNKKWIRTEKDLKKRREDYFREMDITTKLNRKVWKLESEIKRLEDELLKQKARNAGLRVK